MGLSFVSIKPSTSESGQCDCHSRAAARTAAPLQHRPSQRPLSLVTTLRNETACGFTSHSKAKRHRAERRHLLRRMTGSRHPELSVVWSLEPGPECACFYRRLKSRPPGIDSGYEGGVEVPALVPRQLPGSWQGRKEGLHTSEHLRPWCAMAGSMATQLQCAFI
jgi:hypothetical protein